MTALLRLETFTADTLPDLDVVVRGALEFFNATPLPALSLTEVPRPLVIGSGNAHSTGKVLFSDLAGVFADEGTYKKALEVYTDIDAVVLISASGSKHARAIAADLQARDTPLFLITSTSNSPAAEYFEASRVVVFPKVREPYTYNTSTYMGMMLAKSKESPSAILQHIDEVVAASLPLSLGKYHAFCFLIPPAFAAVGEMLQTKFDELFGPKVAGRIFTFESVKHAKTVVASEHECFISFGEENTTFGIPENRMHIPLLEDAGPAALMAVGYYVIGCMQRQHPPYFKESLPEYVRQASTIFNTDIPMIVEA